MRTAPKRSQIVIAICATITLLFAILWAQNFGPLHQLEYFARDLQAQLCRKTPFDPRLVFIGVDRPIYYQSDLDARDFQEEPALGMLTNNFPWSRAVWARAIDKLSDAGAKVIAVDLIFASPGTGDEELRQSIEKHSDRVVLGYNISSVETDRGTATQLQLPNPSVLAARGTNAIQEDDRLGYINVWADFDGIVREANYRLRQADLAGAIPSGAFAESLESRILRKLGRPI